MLLLTMLKILTWIYNSCFSPNGVIHTLRLLNTVSVSVLKDSSSFIHLPQPVLDTLNIMHSFASSLSLSISFFLSHPPSLTCSLQFCCIFYNTIVILNEDYNELWIVSAGVMAECFVCVWRRYWLVSYLQPLMWWALIVRSEK